MLRVTNDAPGKRVAGSLYVHREALDHLPDYLIERARWARQVVGDEAAAANVVRFDTDGVTALLAYEDFDAAPFPALRVAWRVDGAGGMGVRRFDKGDNPPILHRKELLLAPGDPRREGFARLTAELDALGLLKDARRIGRRRDWQARLAAAGVRIEGHRVVRV